MQDHFYHLRPNYGILFLPKFQPLDQGPASVERLIAFWVLLRQQLLNDSFVSDVNAQLCHVVKKKKKKKKKKKQRERTLKGSPESVGWLIEMLEHDCRYLLVNEYLRVNLQQTLSFEVRECDSTPLHA